MNERSHTFIKGEKVIWIAKSKKMVLFNSIYLILIGISILALCFDPDHIDYSPIYIILMLLFIIYALFDYRIKKRTKYFITNHCIALTYSSPDTFLNENMIMFKDVERVKIMAKNGYFNFKFFSSNTEYILFQEIEDYFGVLNQLIKNFSFETVETRKKRELRLVVTEHKKLTKNKRGDHL
ncbi:MAG: hypothetical protein KGD65_16945 [Candidatus Lokiarchaeota archaeon]|nr:hypothetical protein [Candidatus Lokiarchaeota archaeon]